MSLPIRMGALCALAYMLASPVSWAQAAGAEPGPRTDLESVDRAHDAYLRKGGLQSGRPDPDFQDNPLDTPVGGLPSESSGSGGGADSRGPTDGELQLERPEAGGPETRPKPARGELQLERPESDAPADLPQFKPQPKWLKAISQFLESLGPFLQFIFWTAIAVVAASILYFLFGEAIRVRFGKSGDLKPGNPDDILPDIRPDADRARSLLEEADLLAQAGAFAEAVHLLLFRSIDDIQQRLEGGVPRSLTAREIGGLGLLPDHAKMALSPIIMIVERSFFGDRDVDEVGWKTARGSYEHFAFGAGWE